MDPSFFAVAANQVLPVLDEPASHELLAQLLMQAGVTMVRMRALRWSEVQPFYGDKINWGLWPQIYEAYTIRGIKIVVPIIDTPDWAVNLRRCNGPTSTCMPRIHYWNRFVYKAAKRFPDVYAWEIWNEPDLKQFFTGDKNDYLILLNNAYGVIKNVSDAQVWGPAILPSTGMHIAEHVAKYGTFDEFTYHDYGMKIRTKKNNYRKIKDLLNKYKLGSMGISVTEVNKAPMVCSVFDRMTDVELAVYLNKTYEKLAELGAHHVFWWKPVDTYQGTCNNGVMRDGLLTPNYEPKATYYELRRMINE